LLQLHTKRLHFKRYTEEDLPFVLTLVKNEHVMKYIGKGLPQSEEYARQLIRRMLEQYDNFDDYGLHLLVHKETNAYVGHAGIVAQIIDDAFELELGYWIHPDYWGQGYGKEAAQALAQYADEELELERYIAAIQVGNVGSEKIAKSVGMTLEKIIDMEGKQVQIFKKENDFQHDYNTL
jgi:RimJ/RimL family protein N-acetyltransferase